jgi:CubicO group peptidase (beta-lactamase class C family)
MRIASISKSMTSAVAAKLLENNMLDLDKPINAYLTTIPAFKWNDEEVF